MTKRLLQINTVASGASTAAIMTAIDDEARRQGWHTAIAFGRGAIPFSGRKTIYHRIGNNLSIALHGLRTRIDDGHGLGSYCATGRLIDFIGRFKPDVIYLHNIHGYFLHYPRLFDFLRKYDGRVIWHLHDCWPFTGHCAFYQSADCRKWQQEDCRQCPNRQIYPRSWISRSRSNFLRKQTAFTGLPNLTLVAVSEYLAGEIRKSFLREYPTVTIRNGIDTDVFRPSVPKNPKTVLGVSNIWTAEKGLDDFIRLRQLLPPDFRIVLAGRLCCRHKSNRGGKTLSYSYIQYTKHISDQQELAELYSSASVYVSLSHQEGYQLAKLEALSCGTPIVGYDICGESEGLSPHCAKFVPEGDIEAVARAIISTNASSEACRSHALTHFNQKESIKRCLSLISASAQ